MLLDFPGHFFEQAIKALLCLILLALVGTIGAVVIQTFIDLGHCFAAVGQETELHHHFKQILVDVLTGLAIVEVYRTALAYFIEGRVKVTYLIDAVLVAVLTEIMAFWYREIDPVLPVLAFGIPSGVYPHGPHPLRLAEQRMHGSGEAFGIDVSGEHPGYSSRRMSPGPGT
jgi:uncharacterized membrane protein (DUF373 family)